MRTARSLVGFCEVIPKGFDGIVGPFVIGVTDKQNNQKNKVDPTESIH